MRLAGIRGLLAAVTVAFCSVTLHADVAVVVPHAYTIGNDNFSSFGYDPVNEEFRTGGFGAFQELRWSRILDDSVEPWSLTGNILLTVDQLDLFARDGDPFKSGSFVTWGMNYSPLDGRYFITVDANLRATTGGPRLDEERDLVVLDDRLPDSILPATPGEPTFTVLANTNGVFSLLDRSENPDGSPRAAFESSGVQPGHQVTIFPLELFQPIEEGTYTVTEVVSETELHLDRDPLPTPNSAVSRVGYLLSVQPHLTLKTFRQKFQKFVDSPTVGPRARWKGGVSPDGSTLYLGEEITDTIIAVNTQAREDFDVYLPKQAMLDYVLAERASGRRRADLDPVIYRTVSLRSGFSDGGSTGVSINRSASLWALKYSGSYSIGLGFSQGGVYEIEADEALDPAEFERVYFFVNGGNGGGQALRFTAYDSVGSEAPATPLAPLAAGEWVRYDFALSDFNLADVKGFRWKNDAGASQPTVYLDEIRLKYLVLPEDYGDFSTNGNNLVSSRSQIDCDSTGRVWFSIGETDDIMYTDDGVTIHPFLRSNDFFEAVKNFELGLFDGTVPSTGMTVGGLIVDKMGTVYWSDERSREIWKCPAIGGADNIRRIASQEAIQAALGLPSGNEPRGQNCFTIRGSELLTYNYIDSNTIYKVDMETHDYGDVDQDIDADLEDYAWMQQCALAVPVDEEDPCFTSDVTGDGVVDHEDAGALARFITGPN